MTISAELREAVEAWMADDPDDRDQAELRTLLDQALPGQAAEHAVVRGSAATGDGSAGDTRDAGVELRERFAGRLTFGTAGLRGAVEAGPNRMNRAVVRAATAAVAGWLRDAEHASDAEHAAGGLTAVVVGCDARHRSEEFADEAARVLAGAGIRVHLLPRPCPTPLLAFAVRHLATWAGIMITASHNPATDNGYKLYLGDGAQVIPPVDAEIEERIAALGPLSSVKTAGLDSPLITRHADEVAAAYLDAVTAPTGPPQTAPPPADESSLAAESSPALRVVYTPMHGVAGDLMLRAIKRAGFAAPHVVSAQAAPDPDFPTVAFPNPEEPGALDLALADARALGADLVLASDPDGDRLAVAVPATGNRGDATGNPDEWRVLTGDQVGALLGAYLLGGGGGEPGGGGGGGGGGSRERLVASTIVSSTLLRKIAAAAGARYEQTLTGFKWIARAADMSPGAEFIFGYEEALGYQVGQVVRDKDGIGAALAVLRLAASAKASARRTLADEYDALEQAHGVHHTEQLSPRVSDPAGVMRRIRATPPTALAGRPIRGVTDYASGGDTGLPPSDMLSYSLDNARVVIRPSGTEPKIKAYLEVVEPAGQDPLTARGAAASRAAPLLAAVETLLTG
jgi:phosphomannomutase